MLKIFFFVFYKNPKQNPGCIAVTAIQNLKSIFSLERGRGLGAVTYVDSARYVGLRACLFYKYIGQALKNAS